MFAGKRWLPFALLVVMVLSLLGCGEAETQYTVYKNGTQFLVDSAQGQINDGEHIYQYEFNGDSRSFGVTFTYPNGSTYWFESSNGSGFGGWSDDYAEDLYVSGDVLVDVVKENAPRRMQYGSFLAGVTLLGLGVFQMFVPVAFWKVSYGWRYRNAEPSEGALTFGRIEGAVVAVIGLILLLRAFGIC